MADNVIKLPLKADRLTVYVHPSVTAALMRYVKRKRVTKNDAVRKAIALLDMYDKAEQAGDRIMIVTGHGKSAEYREVEIVG